MASPHDDAATVAPVSFRSGKRRKAYRHRAGAADAPDAAPDAADAPEPQLVTDATTGATASASDAADAQISVNETHVKSVDPLVDDAGDKSTPQMKEAGNNTPEAEDGNGNDDDDNTPGLSVAEILRRRNARKSKLAGGVGFGAEVQRKPGSANASDTSLVLRGGGDAATPQQQLETIGKRFAPQTGVIGELVNRHMEEYIESALARRKRQIAEQQQHQQQHQQQQQQQNHLMVVDDSRSSRGSSAAAGELYSTGTVADRLGLSGLTSLAASNIKQPATSQPATRGKLQEIDLGDEARARNIAMTERAKRRLNTGAEAADSGGDDGSADPDKKRTRLGPDGRPRQGARNQQRGDDDIQRDRMVEEFLNENKMGMYDVSGTGGQGNEDEDEELAADDRIAEKFRREFIDALVERRQQRRQRPINAPPRSATQRVNPDEILRGPKLGGSRNSRAQVRDALLKEQVEKRRQR